MNREDFLVELEDILEREEECKLTDKLSSYEEWDSLSMMALMAFFSKKFDMQIQLNDLRSIETIEDLIVLAQGKII